MRHAREVEWISLAEGALAVARRELLVLAVATQAQNEGAILVASGRLQWALACAVQFAAHFQADFLELRPVLEAVHTAAQHWLPSYPRRSPSQAHLQYILAELQGPYFGLRTICADNALLTGLDLNALPLTGLGLRGSRVVLVNAKQAWLDSADAKGVWISRSCFEAASMHACAFDGATLEDCDLSRANLDGTIWRSSSVTRCDARGAVLVNSRLAGSRFVDCNFQGASFGGSANTADFTAEFIRCDLRGTSWNGRDLSRISFTDCQMYGMSGAVTGMNNLVASDVDLSPRGDRSRKATKAELLASWRQNSCIVDLR